MADTGDLNTNQRKALAALLTCATVREAAAVAGLGETTLYRYLGDDRFKAELRRRQDAIIGSVTASLVGLAGEAVQVLRDIQKDPGASHAVKVRAALGWLKQTHDAVELADLAQRVSELEERLNDGNPITAR